MNTDKIYKGATSTIKRIDNLIHKNVKYVNKLSKNDLSEELITREIYWLKKLENYNIAPKFIKRIDNTIVMTYYGEVVTKNELNSLNIQKQLIQIMRILMENYCF